MARKWKYIVIALLVVGFGAVNWVLWPREEAPAPSAQSGDNIYLYCPKCGFEELSLPGSADHNTPCPNCSDKGGSIMRPSAVSHRDKPVGGPSPFLTIAFIDINYLLATALVFAKGHQRAAKKQEELLYFIYVCRKCRRRLRYLDRQVGHLGKCPACKHPFMFPEPTSPPLTREEVD